MLKISKNPANRKFMLLLPALFYFFFRFFPSIKKKKDTLFFIGFFLISFFFVYLQQILSMIGTFISLMFIGILWVNSPKINFQKLFIFALKYFFFIKENIWTLCTSHTQGFVAPRLYWHNRGSQYSQVGPVLLWLEELF